MAFLQHCAYIRVHTYMYIYIHAYLHKRSRAPSELVEQAKLHNLN